MIGLVLAVACCCPIPDPATTTTEAPTTTTVTAATTTTVPARLVDVHPTSTTAAPTTTTSTREAPLGRGELPVTGPGGLVVVAGAALAAGGAAWGTGRKSPESLASWETSAGTYTPGRKSAGAA